MALIQFTGTSGRTSGELPEVGNSAPDFELTKRDLTQITLKDFIGKKMVLNIQKPQALRIARLPLTSYANH